MHVDFKALPVAERSRPNFTVNRMTPAANGVDSHRALAMNATRSCGVWL
jgi:hypothetical protein